MLLLRLDETSLNRKDTLVNPISAITDRIVTAIYVGAVRADVEIPDIPTQWGAPGVETAKYIAGWVMALVTVGLVIGGVIAVAALVSSKVLSSGQRTLAITGLVVCFAGAILLGSITALLTFGGTLKLI